MKISDVVVMAWKETPYNYDTFEISECHRWDRCPNNKGKNSHYSMDGKCKVHFRTVKDVKEYCKITYGNNWHILEDSESMENYADKIATWEQTFYDFRTKLDDVEKEIISWAKQNGENWKYTIWDASGGFRGKYSKELSESLLNHLINNFSVENCSKGINWMKEESLKYDTLEDIEKYTDNDYLKKYFYRILYNLCDDLWECTDHKKENIYKSLPKKLKAEW